MSEDEAYLLEKTFIKAIGRGKQGPLVNTTMGGRGIEGMKFSKALVEHLTQSRKVTHSMKTTRKKISEGTKKAVSDLEVRKRISEAQKKRFAEQGPTKGMAGRKHKLSSKRKIGFANKGREVGLKHSEERIERNRAAQLRWWYSPEGNKLRRKRSVKYKALALRSRDN